MLVIHFNSSFLCKLAIIKIFMGKRKENSCQQNKQMSSNNLHIKKIAFKSLFSVVLTSDRIQKAVSPVFPLQRAEKQWFSHRNRNT